MSKGISKPVCGEIRFYEDKGIIRRLRVDTKYPEFGYDVYTNETIHFVLDDIPTWKTAEEQQLLQDKGLIRKRRNSMHTVY